MQDVYGASSSDVWHTQVRSRITSANKLKEAIPLSSREVSIIDQVAAVYPLSVTPYYLSLVDPFDAEDPVRKQIVPSAAEIEPCTSENEDPLSENRYSVLPGLIHRYPDRVLIILTNFCPVFCRHCTRKRQWSGGYFIRSPRELQDIVDYIEAHPAVKEAIISGGEPLSMSTDYLENVLARLRGIKHLEIIRLGSRAPVVMPQRIDDSLVRVLARYGPIWLNTHFNHPHEITPEANEACNALVTHGIPVNNQSVLLRGVNDNLETQIELNRGLVRMKVRPYYLFQCDMVKATAHFWTPLATGLDIIRSMQQSLSGLTIPRFAFDLPGGHGKATLQPSDLISYSSGEAWIRGPDGSTVTYRDPD